MLKIASLMACAAMAAASAAPAKAAEAPAVAGAEQALEVSAQTRQRPRARIRVTPMYPRRNFSTPYPPPYRVEYPGPGYQRDCRARYVQEYRASGTVIVPRVNCRWVRG